MKYAVGQHVRVRTVDGEETGEIVRLPVPPSDVLLTGSPYYLVNVYDVETPVLVEEIVEVVPDVRSIAAVEAWLEA